MLISSNDLLQVAQVNGLAKGPFLLRMACSDATALPLLKRGSFGADLIRFPAGGQVSGHTHPGDHILYVISGEGWVDYEGASWELSSGCCYLIPGHRSHAIRAHTELTLLSVANQHIAADSWERLHVVDL